MQYAQRCYPDAGVAYADVYTLIAGIANDDLDSVGQLSDAIGQRVAHDRYPPGFTANRPDEAHAVLARCAQRQPLTVLA